MANGMKFYLIVAKGSRSGISDPNIRRSVPARLGQDVPAPGQTAAAGAVRPDRSRKQGLCPRHGQRTFDADQRLRHSHRLGMAGARRRPPRGRHPGIHRAIPRKVPFPEGPRRVGRYVPRSGHRSQLIRTNADPSFVDQVPTNASDAAGGHDRSDEPGQGGLLKRPACRIVMEQGHHRRPHHRQQAGRRFGEIAFIQKELVRQSRPAQPAGVLLDCKNLERVSTAGVVPCSTNSTTGSSSWGSTNGRFAGLNAATCRAILTVLSQDVADPHFSRQKPRHVGQVVSQIFAFSAKKVFPALADRPESLQ